MIGSASSSLDEVTSIADPLVSVTCDSNRMALRAPILLSSLLSPGGLFPQVALFLFLHCGFGGLIFSFAVGVGFGDLDKDFVDVVASGRFNGILVVGQCFAAGIAVEAVEWKMFKLGY